MQTANKARRFPGGAGLQHQAATAPRRGHPSHTCHSPPSLDSKCRTQLRILAAHVARALPGHSTLSKPRGHREGRVLTSHPRSAAQNAHAENRTAAYRWCRSLGLPCAMVGRLMPRSPGSRVPSGLPRARGIHRHARRLTRLPPPQELDRSNDGQDHTVLPYARPAISLQYSLTLSTAPETCKTRRDLAAPFVRAWPRAHRGLPSLPAPFAPDAAASTASPARDQDDDAIAPQG